jgi:NADPH-dependent 2,4-dienoyl-CoA reductase/sulfur reductase-like enzyme
MADKIILTNGNSNESHDSAPLEPIAKPQTGIKVIIVGAGFGGLCAAIECHRQGHDVEVYESFKELRVLGDIISFGSNAGRIFRRWFIPGTKNERISDRLDPLSIKCNSNPKVQTMIRC